MTIPATRTFEEIGTEIGQLLFPGGVPPTRMGDALLLVRIFDKQMRIATDQDAFGESPWRDIAGYGLLGARVHEERKKHECPGSVSDQGAMGSSRDREHASAAAPTSAKTKTSASASAEPKPSQPPANCLPRSEDAPARTVTEAASADEAVQVVRGRNRKGRCGWCDFYFHTVECFEDFKAFLTRLL